MIRCEDCKHFFDVNSTVCCRHNKMGLKYGSDRLSKTYKLSKMCKLKEDEQLSEFYGPITDEHITKFESIYMDTSKSAKDLKCEHRIHNQKWNDMAKIVKERTGYIRPRFDSTKEGRYISKRIGAKQTYFIVKFKNEYYGSYKSYEDAKKVRDAMESHGWNKDILPYVKKSFELE